MESTNGMIEHSVPSVANYEFLFQTLNHLILILDLCSSCQVMINLDWNGAEVELNHLGCMLVKFY